MKRSERHHLKQDEFVHWLDELFGWGAEHRRNLLNGFLVVAGASLLVGGLYIYRSNQAETARVLLDQALDQYHGRVLSGTGAPPALGIPTFDSNEEKYQTALASFREVADGFGSYDAGRHARYYVGLCHIRLSDLDAATDALADVRNGDRNLLYYLASQTLAAVTLEQGDAPGASEIYRSLIEDTSSPLPKDQLLFELARTEEIAGNREQAHQYYRRVLEEHPSSQLRGDALTRSERLELSM